MTNGAAKEWIDRLHLQPHPEGGYYAETYRSGVTVQRNGESPSRAACTSIYYLLEAGDFSTFHRLASDEIWYFHAGTSLIIHLIDESGGHIVHEMSARPENALSLAIAANSWFAAEVSGTDGFGLCSCAVAPGFEFSEFEIGNPAELIARFPGATETINRLSRKPV